MPLIKRKQVKTVGQQPSSVAVVRPPLIPKPLQRIVPDSEQRRRVLAWRSIKSKAPNYPFFESNYANWFNLKREKGRFVAQNPYESTRLFDWAIDNWRLYGPERLGLIKDLVKQGFDVRMPVHRKELEHQYIKSFIEKATRLGAKTIPIGDRSSYKRQWIRDSFTVIDGIRFVLPHQRELRRGGLVYEFARLPKEERNRRKKVYSPLGEGGAVINIEDRIILVSEEIARKARAEIKFFQEKGKQVFELPAGLTPKFFFKINGKKHLAYGTNRHIDLFINRVPRKQILVVDSFYYSDNKELIDSIAHKVGGYKIIVVPEKERNLFPANFLDLGSGKILVNRGAKKTIKLLRNAGVAVVPTSSMLGVTASLQSGIRCTVNLPLHTLRRLGIQ